MGDHDQTLPCECGKELFPNPMRNWRCSCGKSGFDMYSPDVFPSADEITRLRADLAKAKAENERMRAALKPFAFAYEFVDDRIRVPETFQPRRLMKALTIGHFRAADYAYNKPETDNAK